MEDILKIVEGFIPEDQKADIKAKIDGTIETLTEKLVKEEKRELSKKFGVNLFEEDVEKAFNNDKFVKKEVLLQKEQEYTSKLNEFDTIQKELENLKQEKEFNELGIKLISKGLKPERLEVVKPLLDKEGTIDERVEKLMTKVPEFFVTAPNPTVTTRTVPQQNVPIAKSGFEAFIEKNKIK